MKLVVLLHAVPGREAALTTYEDTVLALLEGEYGGQVLQRLAIIGEGPTEVQVIELPDEQALERFLADPARLALERERASCIARTEVYRSR